MAASLVVRVLRGAHVANRTVRQVLCWETATAVGLGDRRLRALSRHGRDLVAILDVLGVYRYVSPSHERVLGYPPQQLHGQSILDLLHPDDRARAFTAFNEGIAESDAVRAVNLRIRHANGAWRTIEVIGNNRLFDPAVRGVIINARDITERLQAEEERTALLAREQDARALAEAAVRVRDEFLSAVSHDLKNPLVTIKGRTQLLQRRVAALDALDSQSLAGELGHIDTAATRMARMINELVDVARLQAGQALTLDPQPTDLVALAQRIAAEHRHTTVHHSIVVDAVPSELVGTYDAFRVERVLDNLLSNAIKYSPDGGVIVLAVSAESPEWARLDVRDEGLGIPASDLPHIFERFHRAGNVGRTVGAGLGLSGARHIVEQHGGTIAVTSQEGAGATVTVRLPLQPPPQ